jgi:acyl-CoA synthetase (AMP-forming)/AMP-acid ligase II
VYHHRGAYMNAVGNVLVWDMPRHPVYLWTLPMFHCNGWCFPWTVCLQAGTHVCLRKVDAAAMGQACEDCLPGFSPGLGNSLQNTLNQLVPGFGNRQGGVGMGMAGEGGYSTQSSTFDNMGMYGENPLMDPSAQSGMSDSSNHYGLMPGAFSSEEGSEGGGFEAGRGNPTLEVEVILADVNGGEPVADLTAADLDQQEAAE